ncbi:MAG: 50S ribosomal protein L15 [Deltaproteobacteria bacterium]|jgi:large subunit ribosomal protein L15|nr:50S ribosomal protein L15 [Deltaproteobacteria bacterium]
MQLHDIYPFDGERKSKKRVGRGPGSGHGGTAGKGHKGQNAHSGGGVPAGFEGGQMPLQRRLPKRGFKNALFRLRYEVLNLDRLLTAFAGVSEISLEDIYARGLVRRGAPVKILGRGEISVAVTVEAHCFSSSAAEKIQKAGGRAKALEAGAAAAE